MYNDSTMMRGRMKAARERNDGEKLTLRAIVVIMRSEIENATRGAIYVLREKVVSYMREEGGFGAHGLRGIHGL